MEHSTQFTKTSEKITKYIQKKYDSDVAKMRKDLEHPKFDFPVHPVPRIIMNTDGMTTQEKIDEMDIYVWKKDYELIHNQIAEFVEKEKRVFPIILNQWSPPLRSQLEGAKHLKNV